MGSQNASEDFIGGAQDPKVEVKLLPMDASKLPEAQQDTDYYYSGDEDKLMESPFHRQIILIL